jgi:hypothetical protein
LGSSIFPAVSQEKLASTSTAFFLSKSIGYGSGSSSAVKNAPIRLNATTASESAVKTNGMKMSGARMICSADGTNQGQHEWKDREGRTLKNCKELKMMAMLRSWPLSAYVIWSRASVCAGVQQESTYE